MMTTKCTFRSLPLLLVSMLIVVNGFSQIRYVDSKAVGLADGTTWTNAFVNLQVAIDAALPGDSIWVAGGTYYPSHKLGGDSLRHSTFYIAKEIYLFGGFPGTAGTEGQFDSRDVDTFPSIISGDLGIPDITSDNAFHVMYLDHVPEHTLIDGFTIRDGNNQNAGGLDAIGAGVINNANSGSSHPTFVQCTFTQNLSNESGGGIFNFAELEGQADLSFTDCTFTWNRGSSGGAFFSYTDTDGEVNATFLNCIFKANTAPTAGGGAIYTVSHSATSNIKLINCLLSGNYSPGSAAVAGFVTGTGQNDVDVINSTFSGNSGTIQVSDIGQSLSSVFIRNAILKGNAQDNPICSTIDAAYSIIGFGFPGENNLGLDPMFVDPPPVPDTAHVDGDMHLQAGSPALDAGQDAAFPPDIHDDLDHQPRFKSSTSDQTGTIDMGPFEFQATPTGIKYFVTKAEFQVFPNPTHDFTTILLDENPTGGVISILDHTGLQWLNQKVEAGALQVRLSLNQIPAGYYYVRWNHDHTSSTRPLLILVP